jgi:SEC-C motif-containing protein
VRQDKGRIAELKKGLCYCASGMTFELCCQPALDKIQRAKTAQALMRSRYSAFCMHNQDYLLNTWHPSTRPESLAFETQQQWLGLKVVHAAQGKEGDSKGTVEFVARYKINGRAYRLHENSEFLCEDGLWFYTQGTLFDQ